MMTIITEMLLSIGKMPSSQTAPKPLGRFFKAPWSKSSVGD
ncbi:hypothetical protein [Moraxella nonliquefaciens]|nr:hypothetical protein [Moraxella nonliquefaciens]